MTPQKENRGFSSFGFSTILLSFVMICVVTFSALSMVTAYSDYKLSKKVADKNQHFYEAEIRAYEQLAKIDNSLLECYQSSSDENTYYTRLTASMNDYGTFTTTSEGYYLCFVEEIAKDQQLMVTLQLQYPIKASDTFYTIIEWKSVYNREIPENETLNLLH